MDDLGYNDVSWNNPGMATPVLGGLAREGVVLDSYYTQPRCSSSSSMVVVSSSSLVVVSS